VSNAYQLGEQILVIEVAGDYIDQRSNRKLIDNIKESSDGKGYLVEGWTAENFGQAKSLDLLGTDEQRNVIGAGISGFTRIDVARQLGSWSLKSGFRMVARAIPQKIFVLENSRVVCSLKVGDKYE
jgi:uncharacterized protein (DUF1501 family)